MTAKPNAADAKALKTETGTRTNLARRNDRLGFDLGGGRVTGLAMNGGGCK